MCIRDRGFGSLVRGDGGLRHGRRGGGIVGAGGIEGEVFHRAFKALQGLNVSLVGLADEAAVAV